MDDSVGFLDVIAMLGLFVTAFVMWVAWELIVGRKVMALLLAIATFIATWSVARFAGADTALYVLLVEAAVAALLVRVANGGKRKTPS
ncbi:MAG: hypothetical protein PVJ03_03750 [Chromatiaceae bacterium]|jgi:hypothetical protein